MHKSTPNHLTTVPRSVISTWKRLQTRGDILGIIQSVGISKPTAIKALKHGFASSDNILKISHYFSQKAKQVREIEHQALNILNGSHE